MLLCVAVRLGRSVGRLEGEPAGTPWRRGRTPEVDRHGPAALPASAHWDRHVYGWCVGCQIILSGRKAGRLLFCSVCTSVNRRSGGAFVALVSAH